MLRQKKLSLQNSIVNQSLQMLFNQNFLHDSRNAETKNCNSFQPHAKVLRDNQNRQGLRQIDINQQNNIDIMDEINSVSNNKLLQGFGKNFAVSRPKQKDPIFDKIVQLIRNQELKIPASNPISSKKVLVLKDRPSTSLSNQKRKNTQQNEICQGQVVFQLNKKNQEQNQKDQPKASTSRALMNYSKVYRNASGQRFKVRRNKCSYRNSVHLQAQKIILHQKQKKERYKLAKSIQKSALTAISTRQRQIRSRKNRYADQQQFQLAGWEYFQ